MLIRMLASTHQQAASVQVEPSTSMAQGAVVTVGQRVEGHLPVAQAVQPHGVPVIQAATPSV